MGMKKWHRGKVWLTGILFIGIVESSVLHADEGKVIFERECVACHKKMPVTLENFFFNYLLKYSSERKVKEALYSFIKNPTKKRALASEELIIRYGLMPNTTLSDTDLRKAIDTFWETYKVFGKIK